MQAGYTRRQVLTVAIGVLALAGCGAASQPQQRTRAPGSTATGGTAVGAPQPAKGAADARAAAPTPAAPLGAALPLLPGTTGVASGAIEGSIGSPAPAFSLPDLSGNTVDLASLRGRPVLLNFLATTCAPCAQELPLLASAQRSLGDRLLVVLIGVEDAPADLASFIAAHDAAGLMTLADPRGSTARTYHVGLIPTSVFLDADGRIVAARVGDLDGASLADGLGKAGVVDAAGALGSQPTIPAPAGDGPVCCPVPGN